MTSRRPNTTLDEAYAVQHLNVRARQEEGARIVGHRVGPTSAAMPEQMGVDEPGSGVLLNDVQVPHHGVLLVGDLLAPRVEAEVGFRLGRDLAGPDVDADRARRAVA